MAERRTDIYDRQNEMRLEKLVDDDTEVLVEEINESNDMESTTKLDDKINQGKIRYNPTENSERILKSICANQKDDK